MTDRFVNRPETLDVFVEKQTGKSTDLPVTERRRMLDTLVQAHREGRCDINYGRIVLFTELQKRAISFSYNRLVKQQHQIVDSRDVRRLFTNPAIGHALDVTGVVNMRPPAEHLNEPGDPQSGQGDFFHVVCDGLCDDRVKGDDGVNDCAMVVEHSTLSDPDLQAFTGQLDWNEIKSQAVKHGYRNTKSASRGQGGESPSVAV